MLPSSEAIPNVILIAIFCEAQAYGGTGSLNHYSLMVGTMTKYNEDLAAERILRILMLTVITVLTGKSGLASWERDD